jgi:hypothetical protein
VNCSEFEKLQSDQVADSILVSYVNMLEENGELRFLLTDNEKILIKTFRKFQNRIPRFAKELIKNRFLIWEH